MAHFISVGNRNKHRNQSALKNWVPSIVWLLLLPTGLLAATQSPKMPVVPKWSRFEQAFKSAISYSNALQEATLKVQFTSPLGEKVEVYGFWDGGRTWRVRFAPSQPGTWTYKTTCSDASNTGLHNQGGSFLCSAVIGFSVFHQHGPVRVARDRRHFEHGDGTPFFWLADTTWNGARVSEPKDWEIYAHVRLSQKFTVAQWSVAPGEDLKKQGAVTGFPDRIGVNPDFFKRLDAKLDLLSEAGLLSAIVPLAEVESQKAIGLGLADDQAILLVRYVVARWQAEPVAWLLAFDGDDKGKAATRWKGIGQAVFGAGPHAPVILFTGDTPWLLDNFRDQTWVDVFAYQGLADVSDDAWKWAVSGPFAQEWTKEPARPLIPLLPYENSVASGSKKRFRSDDVRRAAYETLLVSPPAGVSYGGYGVVNWDTTAQPKGEKAPGEELPLWQRAMFMPAAKQMGQLTKLVSSLQYWRLRPQPKLVATQPGDTEPQRYIAAAETESKDLALVYVPEERTAELTLDAMPTSPTVSWFNPRTADTSPAVAVVGGQSCQFPTPDPGDWVLVLKAGK
jgi:hypothetical protein